MNLRLSRIAAGLALAGIVTLPAQAAEVFNNGSGIYSGHNPFSFSDIFVAEDFSFADATTVRSLSFNAHTRSGVTLPVSAVNVKFYSDISGVPGTEIFSGVLGVAGSTVLGTDGYYEFTNYYVNTGDINFSGGATYWMGLQVDPAQWDMHWTIPSYGSFGSSALAGDNAGNAASYGSYGHNHMFSLYDSPYGSPAPVPEPETYAMMLAGLGLLALARRRKARAA